MKIAGNRRITAVFYSIIILLSACAITAGVIELATPDSISIIGNADNSQCASSASDVENTITTHTQTNKLFGVIPIKQVDVNVIPDIKLIPCGDVFGVKFFTKGVMVIGLSELESDEGIFSPAQKAGLKVKDIIVEINGKEINTVEELSAIIEQSGGREINIKYIRDDVENYCVLKPVKSVPEGIYKSGLWVRDSTAGIGTMTYYNPKNGAFSGLGHGICDVDTGSLMPLLRGAVVDVQLNNIIKGKEGAPGELKGNFGSVKNGTLLGNTEMGVYGVLDNPPVTKVATPLPIAVKSEVKEGKAKILSNVDGTGVKEYEIEIAKIYHNNEDTKNFIVNVTDDELISKTGGIVQGMSGSPIIQDDKIIGAITHVLISNPKKGYGIFIENMLKSMPELLQ